MLAAVPAVYAVNVAYLVKIPEVFLIEEDTTPDTGDLPLACARRGWLSGAGRHHARLDARGEALVRTGDGRYGILRAPDCAIERVAIPGNPSPLASTRSPTAAWCTCL